MCVSVRRFWRLTAFVNRGKILGLRLPTTILAPDEVVAAHRQGVGVPAMILRLAHPFFAGQLCSIVPAAKPSRSDCKAHIGPNIVHVREHEAAVGTCVKYGARHVLGVQLRMEAVVAVARFQPKSHQFFNCRAIPS